MDIRQVFFFGFVVLLGRASTKKHSRRSREMKKIATTRIVRVILACLLRYRLESNHIPSFELNRLYTAS
uniref:Putative secreted protein n=1 Tax=Ixodes ricinus TaxID=34613 RepID=A0A6B0TR65_IXORI